MTATMTAVATATAAVSRLYPVNGVPTTPTYPYGVYSAGIGRGETYTLDAAHGLRWVGVTFQTFGKTADSALTHMESVTDALLDRRLAIGATTTTPLQASLDSPAINRDPDDNGVVTATQHFTATKET